MCIEIQMQIHEQKTKKKHLRSQHVFSIYARNKIYIMSTCYFQQDERIRTDMHQ